MGEEEGGEESAGATKRNKGRNNHRSAHDSPKLSGSKENVPCHHVLASGGITFQVRSCPHSTLDSNVFKKHSVDSNNTRKHAHGQTKQQLRNPQGAGQSTLNSQTSRFVNDTKGKERARGNYRNRSRKAAKHNARVQMTSGERICRGAYFLVRASSVLPVLTFWFRMWPLPVWRRLYRRNVLPSS